MSLAFSRHRIDRCQIHKQWEAGNFTSFSHQLLWSSLPPPFSFSHAHREDKNILHLILMLCSGKFRWYWSDKHASSEAGCEARNPLDSIFIFYIKLYHTFICISFAPPVPSRRRFRAQSEQKYSSSRWYDALSVRWFHLWSDFRTPASAISNKRISLWWGIESK